MGKSRVGNKTSPKIRVASSVVKKSLLSTVIRTFNITLFVLLSLVVLFTATVFRYVPMQSYSNGVFVKDVGFYGDNIPKSSIVLVDTKKNDNTIVSNLKSSISVHKNSGLFEIVAGPVGKINILDGYVAVNDDILKGKSDVEDYTAFLKNQYLVKCLDGACKKDYFSIVDKDNILGVKLG